MLDFTFLDCQHLPMASDQTCHAILPWIDNFHSKLHIRFNEQMSMALEW